MHQHVKCALFLFACLCIISKAHDSYREFTCKNGQCIERWGKCDGKRDCLDGSDETHAECFSYTCPSGSFRCAYGACINETDKCNGLQDCADNSDELLITCPDFKWFNGIYEPCPASQFQCRNGQCIDKFIRCDGTPDCNDRSDETITMCNQPQFSCPPRSLRCAYGGCVSEMAKCNGVNECADGSDEGVDLCNGKRPPVVSTSTSKPIWQTNPKPTTSFHKPVVTSTPRPTKPPPTTTTTRRTTTTTSTTTTTTTTTETPPRNPQNNCVIPKHPGTTFVRPCSNDNCEEIPENTVVQSNMVVFLKCSEGYVLRDNQERFLLCDKGKWQPQSNIACSKPCPSIMSPSLRAECSFGDRAVSCNDVILPGTQLRTHCSVGYLETGGQSGYSINTCLSNGQWVYPIQKCKHECGLRNINDGLIQDGETANRINHPWNAGIYKRLMNGTFSHICGGTLITPYSVLTAAHCAFSTRGVPQEVINYRIGLAKFYRDYNSNKEEGTQKFELQAIHVNPYYDQLSINFLGDIAIFELKSAAKLNRFVLPACVDGHKKYTLDSSLFGEVVGWGQNEWGDPTPTLQKARLPFVSREECIRMLKHKDINSVTIDKFCAYYNNGTKISVRRGDSGGGLTFEFDGKHFVFGIVSTTLTYDNVNTFTDLRFEGNIDFIMRTIENITFNRP